MKLLILALAAAVAGAPKVAAAAETATTPLQLKPKAALTTSAPQHNFAPFVNPVAMEPDLDLVPRRDDLQDQSRSSCNSDRALCYDPGSGRIVYKPARQFMPDIPGLQRENISVKRDRIVLRYSF
jgi:hypothetical protein